MVGWRYRDDCDCNFCQAERELMATGGVLTTPVPDEVKNMAGPEEVTTKTTVYDLSVGGKKYTVERKESLEERNERIWQAIRGMAGG